MPEFPAPSEGIVLTHFIVSNDIARSCRFYTEVLGGELVMEGEPSVVALANGWIIINVGGGPTDDFDAAHVNGPSSTTRGQVFYETLTWLDGHLAVKNWLCDSCTPNATANVWTVRLKQGLEFHNGKTVTADDVIFSIRRILDPKNPKVGATSRAVWISAAIRGVMGSRCGTTRPML